MTQTQMNAEVVLSPKIFEAVDYRIVGGNKCIVPGVEVALHGWQSGNRDALMRFAERAEISDPGWTHGDAVGKHLASDEELIGFQSDQI